MPEEYRLIAGNPEASKSAWNQSWDTYRIPEEFIKNGAAGNSITLAVIPAIRPGVNVNNRRITQVQINNDEMTLTWTLLNSAGKKYREPRCSARLTKTGRGHAPDILPPDTARWLTYGMMGKEK